MFVPVESPLVTTMPNSNVAGPYGRQADGSKEVLPRSESAAINPRAIWGAAGSQRKQGMAWNGNQLPFFCISLHINFNETTWNNMKQHETTCFTTFFTTWNNYNCNYCILLQRSSEILYGSLETWRKKKCRHQVAGDFGLGHLQLAIAGFSGARPSGSGNFPTVEDFVLRIA